MTYSKPLVSIGMPVYNGERFIQQALDSLLSQDYKKFELIISDNASTDRTHEICLEYEARDERVRYYRNEMNMGSVWNFNRVFALSSGDYFMWAADHDLWHSTFISQCVSILEDDPDVVLAYSRTMLIDTSGNDLGLMWDQIDTRGLSTFERFKYIVLNLSFGNMIYGVIRTEQLGCTGLNRNVWSPDIALIAELSLLGSFAQILDAMFFRRRNRPDLSPEMSKIRVLFALDPITAREKSKQSLNSLYRDLGRVHLKIVDQAPFSFMEKVRADCLIIWPFWLRRPWRNVRRIVSNLQLVVLHKTGTFKIAKKYCRWEVVFDDINQRISIQPKVFRLRLPRRYRIAYSKVVRVSILYKSSWWSIAGFLRISSFYTGTSAPTRGSKYDILMTFSSGTTIIVETVKSSDSAKQMEHHFNRKIGLKETH